MEKVAASNDFTKEMTSERYKCLSYIRRNGVNKEESL